MYKDIKGYKGHYKISDSGTVITESWGRVRALKQAQHKGYRRVCLQINNKKKNHSVHRLVAEAFIPNLQNKPQVNHKDGNKSNNDSINLEWVTITEQTKHKREILGWTDKGKKNGHYGYSTAKLYPSEELRNELVKYGLPRRFHNLAELGERLPILKTDKEIYTAKDTNGYFCGIMGEVRFEKLIYADTEANCRAKMWLYLKEEGLLKENGR